MSIKGMLHKRSQQKRLEWREEPRDENLRLTFRRKRRRRRSNNSLRKERNASVKRFEKFVVIATNS